MRLSVMRGFNNVSKLLNGFAGKCGLTSLRRHIATMDNFSMCSSAITTNTGLILGLYYNTRLKKSLLTPTAERFNIKQTNGRLMDLFIKSGQPLRKGETRIFWDLVEEFPAVVLVGLGDDMSGYSDAEQIDHYKENIRVASSNACRTLQELKMSKIILEGFGNSEAAAEGAVLGTWMFQPYKQLDKQVKIPDLELYPENCDISSWKIGVIKAQAQNLARELTEIPANLLTPRTFAQNAVEILCRSGINVEVKVNKWAESQNMGAFLGVGRGSCESPIFLELSYYGDDYDQQPIVLIGSGVTFDSGGICLKDPQSMQHMRGDMSGAATVVAVMRAISTLQLPINARGLIPLCENMPGCDATKPGDIVTARNGKKILIEDTSHEARLVIADALHYARNFNPKLVIDIASISPDIRRVLGSTSTGVFTDSDYLWHNIQMASVHSGDRVWRFPTWKMFSCQVSKPTNADLTNVGTGIGAGPSKAASFLKYFTPSCDWIHLDTCGVNISDGLHPPYLRRGMSGRPTRTVIEFIAAMFCHECPNI